MSRKQYKPHVSTHEKKLTKKERKKQLEEQRNQQNVDVTEEDTMQIKNLALYATIGILLLLALMYWLFINSI